jgi:hypothetical protein
MAVSGPVFITVFIAACVAAQTSTPALKTIYTFGPYSGAAKRQAALIIGADGVLYGRTADAGIWTVRRTCWFPIARRASPVPFNAKA